MSFTGPAGPRLRSLRVALLAVSSRRLLTTAARVGGRAPCGAGGGMQTDRHLHPCPASQEYVLRPRWPAGSIGTSGWPGPRRGRRHRKPGIGVISSSSPPLPRWRPFGTPPFVAV